MEFYSLEGEGREDQGMHVMTSKAAVLTLLVHSY